MVLNKRMLNAVIFDRILKMLNHKKMIYDYREIKYGNDKT